MGIIGSVIGGAMGVGVGKGITALAGDHAASPEEQLRQAGQESDRIAQGASGQTFGEEREIRERANVVLEQLRQQGLEADDAYVIQQMLVSARGDELTTLVGQLEGTSQAVQSGMMSPQTLSQMGNMVNQAIMQQVASGNPDLQAAFQIAEQQGAESIPELRSLVTELQDMGRSLGTSDPNQFAMRFDPMLRRINQSMEENLLGIRQNLNARGIDAGSSAEARMTELAAREYSDAVNEAALRAQAAEQQQRLGEYAARSEMEPGNLLRIRGDQRASLDQLMGRQQTGVGENLSRVNLSQGVLNAAGGVYGNRLAESDLASQRWGQTLGTYLDQSSVPQTQRLGFKAGVTPSIYGSAASVGTQNASRQTHRDISNQNLILGASQTGAGIGSGMYTSDEQAKDVVGAYPPEEGLKAVMQMPIARYYYKGDGEAHVGGMAQDMPPEILNNEGTAVSVQDQLGVLTSAIQELYRQLQEQKGSTDGTPMGRLAYG